MDGEAVRTLRLRRGVLPRAARGQAVSEKLRKGAPSVENDAVPSSVYRVLQLAHTCKRGAGTRGRRFVAAGVLELRGPPVAGTMTPASCAKDHYSSLVKEGAVRKGVSTGIVQQLGHNCVVPRTPLVPRGRRGPRDLQARRTNPVIPSVPPFMTVSLRRDATTIPNMCWFLLAPQAPARNVGVGRGRGRGVGRRIPK